MCNLIAQAVWDYQGIDLSGPQKAILSRMAWYAAFDGTKIYPSLNTLSKQTNFSIPTIKRCLLHFKNLKFLFVDKKPNKGKRKSTQYRINFEKINMAVPIEAAHLYKLSPKSVDKSVKKSRARVREIQVARVTEIHELGSERAIIDHDHRSCIKDHHDQQQVDDFLSNEVEGYLHSQSVNQKHIFEWIEEFGLLFIHSLIHKIKSSKKPIKTPGAYLRRLIEEEKRKRYHEAYNHNKEREMIESINNPIAKALIGR